MERKIASLIVDSTMSLNETLGAVDLAISKIPDEQEKRLYVHALGGILRIINEEFLNRILKDYPELDPYRK